MTSAVALPDVAQIERLDPALREFAVTRYLENARDRLALALQVTGPEAVASLRAEIATAAEATKQLGLSREIQLDAQEMVRRAEYALGKAIRKGQEAGEIETVQDARHRAVMQREVNAGRADQTVVNDLIKLRPTDLVKDDELRGNGAGIYHLVDDVEPEQFDTAVSEARAEGNVSRANVVRKLREEPSRRTVTQQLDEIRSLASSGHTSGQIGKQLGASEDYIRRIAKRADIAIPADKVMAHTRRLDHTRFVNETVRSLEALASGLDVLDLSKVDQYQIADWSTSLTDSLRALNRLARQIKEMDQS